MDASTSEDGALVLPRDATRPLTLTVAQVAWVPPREVSGLVRTLEQGQVEQRDAYRVEEDREDREAHLVRIRVRVRLR